MAKNKRQEEILEILKAEGFAGVKDLGERLYASQPTVRRDLDMLEKAGLVRRSHGGAVLAGDAVSTPVSYRRGKRAHEKMCIGRLAATLIGREQLIFADASSTALFLSDHIRESEKITVVTNGIPMCQALSRREIKVFSTGGRLLDESMAFAGNIAERAVEGFKADVMLFSAASLDDEGMITDYSEEEIYLRNVMLRQSKKAVFLCDSGKFSKSSSFCQFDLSHVDYMVTDALLSDKLLEKYDFSLIKEGFGARMYYRKR